LARRDAFAIADTDGSTDRHTDGSADSHADGKADGHADGRPHGYADRAADRNPNGLTYSEQRMQQRVAG
jgi:hypothetical protein